MRYQPTLESLGTHPLPDWFHDAKFGIFVHWTVSSIPAFAPPNKQGIGEVDLGNAEQVAWMFKNTPYAEWYWNSINIDGSPAQRHHRETYGADYPYDNFVPQFMQLARGCDLDAWADLFARAGARYVVFVTKHHDGVLLWPSAHPNPHRRGWQAERDFVGELTRAVRARGLRMGLYYSGGIDWTFHGLPIHNLETFLSSIPQSENYAGYADAHWRELIERYEPEVLWNDIGYPEKADAARLFADYYNRTPDGVVNNRFQLGAGEGGQHCDFVTPEYAVLDRIIDKKWESTRGIGGSFGFNRAEPEDCLLSAEEIVHMIADVASKNGNLLLNVGPTANGIVPWAQASRLLAVGEWLRRNGEAIYGTRPWRRPDGRTAEDAAVRFTKRGGYLYAIVLAQPRGSDEVVFNDLSFESSMEVRLLGYGAALRWQPRDAGVAITLPGDLPSGPAYVLRFSQDAVEA
ncbi:MAG TPA: alpha-L-fucosidase [Candidatus Binatia bacterium]|nr:alpha-L-fucosidase [Candidatus Binatia bacterium]